MRDLRGLNPVCRRLARGAHKFAQRGDIGAISADSSRVYRQAQAFGGFHVDPRIVEFGQAKPNGWKHSLRAARIHRAWRTAPLPGTCLRLRRTGANRSYPTSLAPASSGTQDALTCISDAPTTLVVASRRPLRFIGDYNGPQSGIRHILSGVQHRLGMFQAALRKRNYRIGGSTCPDGHAADFERQRLATARFMQNNVQRL